MAPLKANSHIQLNSMSSVNYLSTHGNIKSSEISYMAAQTAQMAIKFNFIINRDHCSFNKIMNNLSYKFSHRRTMKLTKSISVVTSMRQLIFAFFKDSAHDIFLCNICFKNFTDV